MNRAITLRLIPALITIAFSGSAAAAGFQLQNQTGSGNGNAFAGAAAAAEDAGTVMWNPAGMTYLPKGHNVALGGTILHRSIKFSNNGSTPSAGFPLGTTDGGDAGGTSLIPFGYWAYSVSDKLWLGMGISPTFGNVTEYDFSFVGRNAGFYANIEQINFNPSVAYKVNDMISLGGGVNVAYNATHFKQGLAFASAPAIAGNNQLDLEGDDWAFGYNLGVMLQVTPTTRIGLSYRSELEFNLQGDQRTTVTGFGSPLLANVEIEAVLKTPANASLALSQKVGDRLEVLADFTWTNWSVIDQIQLKNKATGANLSALSYNFQDTWRIGLGGNYQLNEAWKLKFGVAYDKSPVKSAADRTMTLPDSDRTWLSVGARYQLSKTASIDMGYTHIFFASADTARAVQFPAGNTVQVIRGDFKTSVDSLGMQLNYNF
ncbi:MAG: outer membrane protein transport protein [Dechloromonas sp.]|nr:outer membrane protein transport protein [Dechloromonas sp.]